MKDYLVRALAFDGMVRAVSIDLTQTVAEAQKRHNSMPTATAALGRLMVAAAVMGSTLKDNQQLTLQIKADGPLGTIAANGNWQGDLRGFIANPSVVIPPRSSSKLDVAAGVGTNGMLYVTKDLGFGEPYHGSAKIISGEIAQDIANYYVVSEQVPTVFAAGVLIGQEGKVNCAGGYLIQLLPGAGEDIIDVLEQKIGTALPVTQLMSQNKSPEEILEYLLADYDLQFLGDKNYYQFNCLCSKEYIGNVLMTLGMKELKSLLDEGSTEVCCQFCNECYNFNADEIEQLMNYIKGSEGTEDERN